MGKMKYICKECDRTVGTVYYTKHGALCVDCFEGHRKPQEQDSD